MESVFGLSVAMLCEYNRYYVDILYEFLTLNFPMTLPSARDLVASTPQDFTLATEVHRFFAGISSSSSSSASSSSSSSSSSGSSSTRIAAIVLDCKTIPVQCASHPTLHRMTFDPHHKRHGVKLFTVCDGKGTLLYVDTPWKQTTSDAAVLEAEFLSFPLIVEWLKKISRDTKIYILANRGFRLSADDVAKLPPNVFLRNPLSTDDQYAVNDAIYSAMLSRFRWVIEAAHAQIHLFRELVTTVPLVTIPDLYKIVVTVAILCRIWFRPPACSWTLTDIAYPDEDEESGEHDSISAEQVHMHNE